MREIFRGIFHNPAESLMIPPFTLKKQGKKSRSVHCHIVSHVIHTEMENRIYLLVLKVRANRQWYFELKEGEIMSNSILWQSGHWPDDAKSECNSIRLPPERLLELPRHWLATGRNQQTWKEVNYFRRAPVPHHISESTLCHFELLFKMCSF